jgi:hypothetical protein
VPQPGSPLASASAWAETLGMGCLLDSLLGIVEPGTFTMFVGTSSEALREAHGWRTLSRGLLR